MNASNAVTWLVIGAVAFVALYLKGYIPLTWPWIKTSANPIVRQVETLAMSELESLLTLAANKAKELAEQEMASSKIKQVADDLMSHFKASATPVPLPPSGPPAESGPGPAR